MRQQHLEETGEEQKALVCVIHLQNVHLQIVMLESEAFHE